MLLERYRRGRFVLGMLLDFLFDFRFEERIRDAWRRVGIAFLFTKEKKGWPAMTTPVEFSSTNAAVLFYVIGLIPAIVRLLFILSSTVIPFCDTHTVSTQWYSCKLTIFVVQGADAGLALFVVNCTGSAHWTIFEYLLSKSQNTTTAVNIPATSVYVAYRFSPSIRWHKYFNYRSLLLWPGF